MLKQLIDLQPLKRVLAMAAIVLFGIMLLASVTKNRVLWQEKNHLEKTFHQLLPDVKFDEKSLVAKPFALGYYYTICQDTQPIYQLLQVTTMQGYNGKIELLIALDLQNQRVFSVLPLFHQETPGLGDAIEPQKSAWLMQFSETFTPLNAFLLKKDGGQIDALLAATITSRAVANLIEQAIAARPVAHCIAT